MSGPFFKVILISHRVGLRELEDVLGKSDDGGWTRGTKATGGRERGYSIWKRVFPSATPPLENQAVDIIEWISMHSGKIRSMDDKIDIKVVCELAPSGEFDCFTFSPDMAKKIHHLDISFRVDAADARATQG